MDPRAALWLSLSLLVMMVFIIVIVVIIIVSPSLSLLLPSSCFCPTPAVLLPCSLQTPILHKCTCLASPQFLPSSCPLSSLLCFTIFSSAPALYLPCSCPAPSPAHPSLAAFIIIISTLQLFSARRQPPFMVLNFGA